MVESSEASRQGTEEKAKILVVDDSKLVRKTATKILSDKFNLVLAEDGEEAWKLICADDSIQVVFTDLGMPNLDGYGLIERMRQSENEGIRNQPIIVLTGAAEEESVRRKVFEIGATDFITKPFKSTEIIARAEAHASYRRDKSSLQKNVDIDLLTGTLNRNGLSEQLERDVSFVNRHAQNLAVLVFELDDFKTTYQKLGKQSSERIVKQVATTLLAAVRKEDSIGRHGFAKFAVILPMAKTEGVVMLAKRLCARVGAFKMSMGGQALSITMSCGIATISKGDQTTAKDLLQSSESALNNAQKMGRGEVQLLKLESNQADEAFTSLSIDSLLEAIDQGKTETAQNQMDAAVSRLAPLIALMSAAQKRKLVE